MKQDEILFSWLITIPRMAWSGLQMSVSEIPLAFHMRQETAISVCLG